MKSLIFVLLLVSSSIAFAIVVDNQGTEYRTKDESHDWGPKDQRIATLYNIDHDGHRFVVARYFDSVAMLHHPDCPCSKKQWPNVPVTAEAP